MAEFKEPRPEERDDGACAQWCLTEFDGDNIGLDYDKPTDFLTSQWPLSQRKYIVYRVVVALTLLGWLAGDIVYESEEFYHNQAWRWFGFASNWSFALLTLSALMQMVTTCVYAVKPYWIIDPIFIRSMPIVLKVQWVLHNMATASALVVTAAYWAFIAFVSDAPVLTSDMSRLKHTANTIYVIADLMMTSTPVRAYHAFYTVFLGSLYTVFNALYYLNHGSLLIQTNATLAVKSRTYYFMNWVQPVEAICTCVLAVVMCMVSQVVLHLLFLWRTWIHSRLLPGATRGVGDAELQQIIGGSNSYNSIDEVYGERAIHH